MKKNLLNSHVKWESLSAILNKWKHCSNFKILLPYSSECSPYILFRSEPDNNPTALFFYFYQTQLLPCSLWFTLFQSLATPSITVTGSVFSPSIPTAISPSSLMTYTNHNTRISSLPPIITSVNSSLFCGNFSAISFPSQTMLSFLIFLQSPLVHALLISTILIEVWCPGSRGQVSSLLIPFWLWLQCSLSHSDHERASLFILSKLAHVHFYPATASPLHPLSHNKHGWNISSFPKGGL